MPIDEVADLVAFLHVQKNGAALLNLWIVLNEEMRPQFALFLNADVSLYSLGYAVSFGLDLSLDPLVYFGRARW
jgi:hypothetical protein